MHDSLTASAISFKPVKWDKPGNCERLETLFVQAAKEKPDLILATEGALEGYVVMDVIEGRRSAQEMWEIAEPMNGPSIRRFQKLAAQLDTCLAFGFAERIGEEVYNAAVFIDRKGDICGSYHKSQLAEGSHPDWTFNRLGRKLRAFDTPLGRLGFVICNDRWNPLLVRAVVADGARLLLIPAYGERGKRQNQAVLARGRENGVPIVEANVGMNLIVNRGEIAAYAWGHNRVTTAQVDLPWPVSPETARRLEADYLAGQDAEMARRYAKTMEKLTDK